ncbi:MAG: hypothetical protein FJW30_00510 [Acidobacteria bacterium]|nr:hypothetical protein [Acidobacteriota bacterium]
MRLDLQLDSESISTFEEPRVVCRLTNDAETGVEAPGPFDRSGAFGLALLSSAEEPLRRMDRQTRQKMLNTGRVDTTADTQVLEPGEGWRTKIDLASFHYPVPPGEYLLRAECGDEQSEPVELNVREQRPLRIEVTRDNPILDAQTLLFTVQGDDGVEYYLRQHNAGRPLGAWYSRRVLAERNAASAFVAAAGFYQAESLDLAYRKWVVWLEDGAAAAAAVQDGVMDLSTLRKAELPAGAELLRAAVWTRHEELYIFFRTKGTGLSCQRLERGSLERVFDHTLRSEGESPVAVSADAGGIQVVSGWRGLLVDRLRWRGTLEQRLHVFRSRLQLKLVHSESPDGRVRALFTEAGKGPMMQMVCADFRKDSLNTYSMDKLPFGGEPREYSFDCDFRGRFHLLVSTNRQALYYMSEERGPHLVATGEERFHPVMCAPKQVYVGLYRREHGFRFVQFQRRRVGEKLPALAAHPSLG